MAGEAGEAKESPPEMPHRPRPARRTSAKPTAAEWSMRQRDSRRQLTPPGKTWKARKRTSRPGISWTAPGTPSAPGQMTRTTERKAPPPECKGQTSPRMVLPAWGPTTGSRLCKEWLRPRGTRGPVTPPLPRCLRGWQKKSCGLRALGAAAEEQRRPRCKLEPHSSTPQISTHPVFPRLGPSSKRVGVPHAGVKPLPTVVSPVWIPGSTPVVSRSKPRILISARLRWNPAGAQARERLRKAAPSDQTKASTVSTLSRWKRRRSQGPPPWHLGTQTRSTS